MSNFGLGSPATRSLTRWPAPGACFECAAADFGLGAPGSPSGSSGTTLTKKSRKDFKPPPLDLAGLFDPGSRAISSISRRMSSVLLGWEGCF
jgi:hypothetical protein